MNVFVSPVFKVALKEAEFQRKEHIRKQGTVIQKYQLWRLVQMFINVEH